MCVYTGFPQALENIENGWKKNPCMEKSWNLKINEKIREFWHEIAFWMSVSCKFFSLASLAQRFKKKSSFSFFEQSNPKPSFLHHKIRFFMLIQLFMQHIYFCLLYNIIWQKEGRVPYFEWSWKFNDCSWNYHGKIMEFYFVFSVGTLSTAYRAACTKQCYTRIYIVCFAIAEYSH